MKYTWEEKNGGAMPKSFSALEKNILKAKAPDMPVQAEDIIYVPRSRMKAALSPGVLLNTAAAVAIYHVPW